MLVSDNLQPPDERLAHGDVKGYRVNCSSVGSPNGSFFQEKETRTSVSVSLPKDISYSFTVEAETESGYNTTLAPETIFISSLLESNCAKFFDNTLVFNKLKCIMKGFCFAS